jgi:Fe-S cluster assembly protein SufD
MSSAAFVLDTVPDLRGPDWLSARRTAAAERFAATGLPTAEEEVWRYSPIGRLDLGRYRILPTPTGYGGAVAVPEHARAALVGVVDGAVVHAEVEPRYAEAGLYAGRLLDHPDAETLLGSVLREPVDAFSDLNDAFLLDPVAIVVPPGLHVDRPIVVVQVTATADAAVFPRLVVHAGEGSDARVLEHQRSGDRAALVVPVVELHAARAARLGFANVQDLGRASWQIGSHVADVGQDATVVVSTAALGGAYARVRTDCRLVGRGATGNLTSLYFGDGDQTLDFRTFQDHAAPDTTSNLLFKGVVADRSRSVYTGLIHVGKDARGTNAFQTNRNIKLSADAWAESVPNLEIENNEVHCSHASTVGPIDDEQRFYLESRGVPPAVAERLIVAGFFAEVLQQVPVAEAVPELRTAIAAKLDRRGSS